MTYPSQVAEPAVGQTVTVDLQLRRYREDDVPVQIRGTVESVFKTEERGFYGFKMSVSECTDPKIGSGAPIAFESPGEGLPMDMYNGASLDSDDPIEITNTTISF